MRRATPSTNLPIAGFTLIEVMITVVIVGILAAIALPSYGEFVIRGKLMDAHTKLADLRGKQEIYWSNNNTYVSVGTTCGVEALGVIAAYMADTGAPFDVECAGTATTYLIKAKGRASKGMASFELTVDQANAKTSTGPAGWTSASCWFVRKNGDCS
jgi:type IV pilus assembly protein PilE